MSNKLRNPFILRASEKIESVANFLRLYSPFAIDVLIEKHAEDLLWNNVLLIHSSPGAGKTSLLRVFEPISLRTLFNSKSSPDYRELFAKLKKLGVINEERVELLGVVLLCTRNYETLEELAVSDGQKKRFFFFSLLNSRIILSTLRAILQLHNKPFPEGLVDIVFKFEDESNYFLNLTVPCNGHELYKWASEVEKKVYLAIDSFLPVEEIKPDGHDELFSLSVLKPEFFTVEGKPLCSKILFMLDDTHKLSSTQRTGLLKFIIEKRGNFNLWVSERLEALEQKENLGSFQHRDYQINLQRFWDENKSKFDKILDSIANKRASISTEDVNSFQENIESYLDEEKYQKELNESIVSTLKNITNLTSHTSKFVEWIKYVHTLDGSLFEKAIQLKEIEIIITRHVRRNQLSLDFTLTIEELKDKIKPDLEAVAKLFVCMEKNIPYYYSLSMLHNLASNNIDQFLSFSSDLFEGMLSNKISSKEIMVTVKAQEKIIRNLVNKKWDELAKIIPYSIDVMRFLSGFGEYSKKQTYQMNAPYAPGVNGFSIKVDNRPRLINETDWINDANYLPLVNVIATCVAYNLLQIRPTKQGEKGQPIKDVYYLNRWICVKFNLPLSYGEFRYKSPSELVNWIKK